MKKTFFEGMIIAMVIFAAFATCALADTGACGKEAVWEYEPGSGYLHISGFNAIEDSPAEVYISEIETVYIENSLTVIGKGVFEDYENLKEVIFEEGSSINTIGDNAFAYSGLESFTIPSSVIVIGERAFMNCADLKDVVFESGSNLEEVGSEAFMMSGIETITIPATVYKMDDRVFRHCVNLKELAFEAGSPIWMIEILGLDTCTALKRIVMPDGVAYFSSLLTRELPGSLEEIVFLNSSVLMEIDRFALKEVRNLRSIILPPSLKSIGAFAFAQTGLEKIMIPASVTLLETDAFFRCDDLTEIVFEEGSTLNVFKAGWFEGSDNLKKIVMPDGQTRLMEDQLKPFAGTLKELVFNDSSRLKTIDANALNGFTALETLRLPKGLESVGENAFGGCKKLKHLYFAADGVLSKFDATALNGCTALESVRMPDNDRLAYDFGENIFFDAYVCSYSSNAESYCETYNIPMHYWASDSAVPALKTDAGCETNGYSKYVCPECGKENVKMLPALGHTWKEDAANTANVKPTCTKDGVQCYVCETCSDTKQEALPALGHTLDNGTVTPATCAKTGRIEYKCTNTDCSYSMSTVLPVAAHDWGTGVVTTAPTCTSEGERTYTCAYSDCAVKTKTEKIPQKAHELGDGVVTAATCAKEGKVEYKCKNCTYTTTTVLPKAEHNWGTGVITKDATCTETGEKTYTCAYPDCEVKTKTETIPQKAHELSEGTVTPATCAKEGKVEYKCENCTYTTTTVLPKVEHNWGTGIITKDATCTETGEKTYTCAYPDCEVKTKTETIPKKAHELGEGTVTPATCANTGKVEYKCSNCAYTTTTVLPKVEHSWGTGIITKDATCTETGEKTYTCAYPDCEIKTRTEKIAALGHDYQITEVKQPTCGADGEIVSECALCGDKKSVPMAKTGAHIWDNGVITKQPTREAEGEKTYTCTVCSETKTEPIAMLDKYIAVEKVEIKVHDAAMYLRKSKDVTQQLELKFTPENADIESIEWTSADESQAMVSSDGLVTALGKGKCRITVTVIDKDGNKVTDSAIISIKKKTGKVKKISFIDEDGETVKKLKLKVGDRIEEPLKFKPLHVYDDRVKYTFSKKGIVKIENGALIAVKKGKTVLTVKSKNNKKVTAKLTITVK